MTQFKLFGRSKDVTVGVPVAPDTPPVKGNEEDTVGDQEKKDEKHLITITWGTGMPIDVIFNFIHKNFEEEGFQDAMVNSDINYRDAKVQIIRNDLEMLIKRITLRYRRDIREINVKVDNAMKALALDAANRLRAHRETFEEHLVEINNMQELLRANDPKMTTMIESYKRGFQKGVSAASINFINK